jgi:hypothetical protein
MNKAELQELQSEGYTRKQDQLISQLTLINNQKKICIFWFIIKVVLVVE